MGGVARRMNKKRIIITLATLSVAVLILIIILLSRSEPTGTLELRAANSTPDNADVTVQVKTEEEAQTLTLRPGQTTEIQIKTGTVQVTGSAGTLKAVDIVEIEDSSTTELTTPVGENRAIEQIGANAKICPALVGDRVYSYNCQGAGVVVRHASTGDTALFGGQSFSSLKPVKDGLIGFFANDTSVLQYLDLTNESINEVQLPDNIQAILSGELPFITTTDNPDSSRFALMFTQANKVYLLDDLSDQQPAELEIGAGVSLSGDGRATTFSFEGDGLVIYAGNVADSHDGTDNTGHSKHSPELPSYLFEYDLAGKLVNTINLPEEFTAQGMYKLIDGYYVAEWANAFNFYHYRDGRLSLIYNLFGVANWAVSHGKAYIQEGGTLYEFAPTENGLFSLHGLFSSPDLRVSRVFATIKGVVFTGFAGTSTNAPLNVYQLLDTKAEPGAAPAGIVQRNITYTGLDDLLQYGITAAQLEALRTVFGEYLVSNDSPAGQITISDIRPVPHDRFSSSTTDTVNFNATIGNQTVRAKMEYSNLTNIRLFLHNPSNNEQLYDSGQNE